MIVSLSELLNFPTTSTETKIEEFALQEVSKGIS